MTSPTQESTFDSYVDQIHNLENAAAANGGDSPEYQQSLDKWLEQIEGVAGKGSNPSQSGGASGSAGNGTTSPGANGPAQGGSPGAATGTPAGGTTMPAGRSASGHGNNAPATGGTPGNGSGGPGTSTPATGGTPGRTSNPSAPDTGTSGQRSGAPGTGGSNSSSSPNTGGAPSGNGAPGQGTNTPATDGTPGIRNGSPDQNTGAPDSSGPSGSNSGSTTPNQSTSPPGTTSTPGRRSGSRGEGNSSPGESTGTPGTSSQPGRSAQPGSSGSSPTDSGGSPDLGSTPDLNAPDTPNVSGNNSPNSGAPNSPTGGGSPGDGNNTPTQGAPPSDGNNTPTQDGTPTDGNGKSSGSEPTPAADEPPPTQTQPLATSAGEIAENADQDAADTVTKIAQDTAADIAGETDPAAAESIANAIAEASADVAIGYAAAGASKAEIIAETIAAAKQAAKAETLAYEAGGLEAAKGIAELFALHVGIDRALQIAERAQFAAGIGETIGQQAAELTITSAVSAARAVPTQFEQFRGDEALDVATSLAAATNAGGLRAAVAANSVVDLGSTVVKDVASAAVNTVTSRKDFSGENAARSAEAAASAANKANQLAGGGDAGTGNAHEIADMIADAVKVGGPAAAEAISKTLQKGDFNAATEMYQAQVTPIGSTALDLFNKAIAAGSTPQEATLLVTFTTDMAKMQQSGDNFSQSSVSASKAAANAMGMVFEKGGTFNDAGAVGNSILGIFSQRGALGANEAQGILEAVAEQGGSAAEEVAAIEGTQEAGQIGGAKVIDTLQIIAQEGGYKAVQSAMTAIETATQAGIPSADIASVAANSAAMRLTFSKPAADAYVFGLSEGGLQGADQVMQAANQAHAQGQNAVDAAWDAADQVAQANAGATQSKAPPAPPPIISTPIPLAPPPPNTPVSDAPPGASQGPLPEINQPPPPDNTLVIVGPGFANHQILIQNYTKLINDLQSGAGKDTIQADARDVAKAAFKDGNIGTGETAIVVGSSFKPDGSLFYTPSSLVDILRNVDPQTDRGRTLVYGGLGPLDQAYMTLASDVASGADTDTIKQDADTLWGTAVANGHPALGNVALDISRTVGSNSYSQDGSLMALMNMPLSQPDPAAQGFGSPAAPDTPAAGTPTDNTPTDDETKAYQTLVDDLNNGADSNTVTHDTLNLASIADDKQDDGLLEAALIIRRRVQYGTLNPASDIVGLQMAAPGSDGAKTPLELQWAPPTSAT